MNLIVHSVHLNILTFVACCLCLSPAFVVSSCWLWPRIIRRSRRCALFLNVPSKFLLFPVSEACRSSSSVYSDSKLQDIRLGSISHTRDGLRSEVGGTIYIYISLLNVLVQSSGAMWKSRWSSWAFRPDEPYGFRGRKAILNHAHALVSACPYYVSRLQRTLSNTAAAAVLVQHNTAHTLRLEERGVERGSARHLPWKDERRPSSVRRTLEPFQRKRWGNFWEKGWSA